MKYILSAIFLSFAIGSHGALNISEPGSAEVCLIVWNRGPGLILHTQRRTSQTCGDPANSLPFYRGYNSAEVDHYYTTSANLVNSNAAGWPLQEVAAFVFVTQEESTVPFYRLHSNAATDNFYTISTTERDNALNNGYVSVPTDPFTYIYPTQVCGSVPFYRLYHETKKDNFYTISEAEREAFIANQGYTDIEIAGYVLTATPTSQCA
jgi:hypothetical protein